MGEETLTPEEIDSLLEGAEIISDQTGGYQVSNQSDIGEEQLDQLPTEETVAASPHQVDNGPQDKSRSIPTDVVEVSNLTSQQKHNANLLLDIYVQVTVELGRTSIKVKDVLGLGEGSIVELYKPASDPVELLVNNRLIAKGEVVVIDENFGARVTNIVSPLERLTS